MPPNPRLQRTRAARSPLSRQPFGGTRGFHAEMGHLSAKHFLNGLRPVARMLVAASAVLLGCGEPRLQTVQGREDPSFLPKLRGRIVRVHPVGGIETFSLPSLRTSMVRPTHEPTYPDAGTVHSLSGPDADGRIAFIDNFMSEGRHALRVIEPGQRSERTLFMRTGDALWGKEIGEKLALAPKGGLVAFVSHLASAQMDNPPALLREGTLELWDVKMGIGTPSEVQALDGTFSWFPDGTRLAYTALVDGAMIPGLPLKPDDFGAEFTRWTRVPVVCLLDTATKKQTILHAGWSPVVSSDGQKIIVSDLGQRWREVDVASGHSAPATAPGQVSSPLALAGDDTVIYVGLPTAGSKTKYTEHNSPLVGPKLLLTIKIAKLNTSRFQTLIPYHDMRHDTSYGTK